jgi:uncharacterized lipoprotein YmbA
MKLVRNTLVAAVMPVLMVGGSGCARTSPETDFFILSSVTESAQPVSERSPGLGVGPVELPLYLDRPQIVTRQGDNTLLLGEFDQWGEPLRDNFTRVLAENLSMQVPSEEVSLYPWPRSAIVDYQVAVSVSRFDISGKESFLDARWSVLTDDGASTLLSRRSKIRHPVEGDGDYRHMVQALNHCLTVLSEEIAGTLRELHKTADSG